MTAEELKAMSDGDLRELAEEIRHELHKRYNREWNAKNREKRNEQKREWRKNNPEKAADASRRAKINYFNKYPEKRAIRDARWIERTLADVERAEEIAKYENSL